MGKSTEMFFFPDSTAETPAEPSPQIQEEPAATGAVGDMGKGTEFFFFGDGDDAPQLPTQLETPVPPAEASPMEEPATKPHSTVPMPAPSAEVSDSQPSEDSADFGSSDTESFFFEDLRPPEARDHPSDDSLFGDPDRLDDLLPLRAKDSNSDEHTSPDPSEPGWVDPDAVDSGWSGPADITDRGLSPFGSKPKFKDLMSRDVSFRMAQPRGKQMKFSTPKTHQFGPSNFDLDPVEGGVEEDDRRSSDDDENLPPWER